MNTKLPFATIVCLCAAAALAQPPDESGETRGPRGGMPAFPLMMALDADNDGVISPREIKKAVTALKTLDADGDGRLTEDELRPQFPGGDRPNDGPGPDGQRGPGGPGGLGGGQGGPPSAEAFVARALQFDTDQDGKLNQNELAKLAEQFARGPNGRGPAGPRGLGASGAGGPAGVPGGPAGGRRQRGGNANSNR